LVILKCKVSKFVKIKGTDNISAPAIVYKASTRQETRANKSQQGAFL